MQLEERAALIQNTSRQLERIEQDRVAMVIPPKHAPADLAHAVCTLHSVAS